VLAVGVDEQHIKNMTLPEMCITEASQMKRAAKKSYAKCIWTTVLQGTSADGAHEISEHNGIKINVL